MGTPHFIHTRPGMALLSGDGPPQQARHEGQAKHGVDEQHPTLADKNSNDSFKFLMATDRRG